MIEQSRFAAAGEWLLRLQDDDLDAKEFDAWLHWYEADPLNRVAFEEAQSAFESAHGLNAKERGEWARELIHGAQAPAPLPKRAFPVRHAIAAAIVTVATGLAAWQQWGDDEPAPTLRTSLKTPRAMHRLERLPDGSTVQLGARSAISLAFSREERNVVLESGEAFFTVARDTARPFVVQAGSVAVHAVGTEFNVRRDGDSTIVSVREGKVDIVKGVVNASASKGLQQSAASPVRLTAGEQVAARDPEPGLAIKSVHPQAIAAWQKGRLEFADEPLRQVIATVNRYSTREIVLTDHNLGNLRITGTVAEDRIDEWTRALPAIFPVRVVEVSHETVLVSPAPGR